ncbi:MAG: hypothetical protein ONA90_05380 [candidate division KSB1 bacterium]|nr:hypothetical protein [candidate division KSB1 bacterium]
MKRHVFKISAAFAIFSLALAVELATAQNAQPSRMTDKNITVRFVGKHFEADAQTVLSLANRILSDLTKKYALVSAAPVEISLAATTVDFCQRTGRPWWQAAVYREGIIHIQPLPVLRERGILETTLRHELMHRLIDVLAKGTCPAWLDEALAIYYAGEIDAIKPTQQWLKANGIQWDEFEKRLEIATTKEDFDRLYFQLYHLGQFLERNFLPEQMAKFLALLGEQLPFDRACREVFNFAAKAIEQGWLRHWANVSKTFKTN